MIEETEEARKGVEFLTSTRDEWRGIPFEGHLVWHLALYYLGKFRIIMYALLSIYLYNIVYFTRSGGDGVTFL